MAERAAERIGVSGQAPVGHVRRFCLHAEQGSLAALRGRKKWLAAGLDR